MRGGKREGSGRPVGALTKKTREIAEEAVKSGETPLEYMLRVMRDVEADPKRRDEMACAAASFVHPRLANTTLEGGDKPLIHQVISSEPLTPEQWAERYKPK